MAKPPSASTLVIRSFILLIMMHCPTKSFELALDGLGDCIELFDERPDPDERDELCMLPPKMLKAALKKSFFFLFLFIFGFVYLPFVVIAFKFYLMLLNLTNTNVNFLFFFFILALAIAVV